MTRAMERERQTEPQITELPIPESLRIGDQSHLRALIESVRDYAINLLDPDGRILTWNEGSRRIHGLSATEALGRNFSILFPPEEVESEEPARMLNEASRSGRC